MERALEDRTGAIKYEERQMSASSGKLRMSGGMPAPFEEEGVLDEGISKLYKYITGMPKRIGDYVRRTLRRSNS